MNRVVVLGIDGLPFEFAKGLLGGEVMPRLAAIAARGDFRQMDSVHPCVSTAAWTSFITGVQPGKHGLYGFVDRRDGSYEIEIPLATSIAAKNIWQILSEAGKRVFGMNVPVTCPPVEVNGVLVADFLCPSIDQAALSPDVRLYLKSINYQIDSDPALGHKSIDRMLRNLHLTLEKRVQAALHYLRSEEWAYFHAHIMETDRLFHFLYARHLAGDARLSAEFLGFLRKVDDAIGQIAAATPPDAGLIVLSDHGFCPIKAEVNLSRHLVETGWTTPASAEPLHPLDIAPERTRAYTLIPGRIYLNLRGREPEGIVPPEEYTSARETLMQQLLALKAPNGDTVIRQVLRREELFWPAGAKAADPQMPAEKLLDRRGAFGRAPDLVVVPHDGYDLKMGLDAGDVFHTPALEGMHTFNDAMVLLRGFHLGPERPAIFRIARTILGELGVAPPDDMD